jgi:sporulation protein YlmC with PRC-barrel domain
MNNYEIIQAVEQICSPHFIFNINDFYGDRGSSVLPKIDELKTLFFKLDGHKKVISKNQQQEIVDKIKNLNIGIVEISTVQAFGRYIVIKPYEN